MNRLGALGKRARATTWRQRMTVAAGTAIVMVSFVMFAAGATKSPDNTGTGFASATDRPPGSFTETEAERAAAKRRNANSKAKASAGPAAAGDGGGSAGPLAKGVKPGHAVDGLLKHLGVETPPHRNALGALDPVTVGVDYQDAGAANSFFRQYSVDAGAADPGPQAAAVADWINAHGGVGGRHLTLRPRHYDFYRDRLSVLDHATCNAYGTGDKAIADVDRHASTDILIPCLAKHDVPTFVNAQSMPSLDDFARSSGELYSTGSAAIDRAQTAYVRGLKQEGFFNARKKVGVLRSEGLPQLDKAHDALRRALGAEGIGVSADVPVSTEDVASFLLTETNAMLKMRTQNIGRILVVDENGIVAGQFMRNAEGQGYRPGYGLNSIASPQFLAREAPQKQIVNSMGVGWSPLVDVPSGSDPSNPIRESCDGIFAAAHINAGDRTPFGQFTAYHLCDSLLLIASAVRVSGSATSSGLQQGIDAVGPKWSSPLAISGHLDSARHDGAAGWRQLRYTGSCGCFHYEGPTNPF